MCSATQTKNDDEQGAVHNSKRNQNSWWCTKMIDFKSKQKFKAATPCFEKKMFVKSKIHSATRSHLRLKLKIKNQTHNRLDESWTHWCTAFDPACSPRSCLGWSSRLGWQRAVRFARDGRGYSIASIYRILYIVIIIGSLRNLIPLKAINIKGNPAVSCYLSLFNTICI